MIELNENADSKSIRSQHTLIYVIGASRCRSIKSKKIVMYHDKTIKKYLNFVKNATTTFKMIFEDSFIEESKIVFAMQSLTKNHNNVDINSKNLIRITITHLNSLKSIFSILSNIR